LRVQKSRCAFRKVVAIELEVVPFDWKVVAHAIDVVPLGRTAVANPMVRRVLAFVPCRTLGRPIRWI
jgi:hypothetical protein